MFATSVLSMITSVHPMINGTGVLMTKWTWHDYRLRKRSMIVSLLFKE